MSEVEPRLVVERYVAEVLGGSDPASAAELIANPALRRHADSFRAAFPDARVETRQVLTEGDLVAVHLTGHGRHLGVSKVVRLPAASGRRLARRSTAPTAAGSRTAGSTGTGLR